MTSADMYVHLNSVVANPAEQQQQHAYALLKWILHRNVLSESTLHP